MEYREKVLSVIRFRGPSQPLVIAKELMTNSTLAGAMLSEMTDKGLLKVSYLKVGSGPLYYIPGQEEQLLKYLYALNEKDKKTAELLQQKKILRESSQEPLARVGLKTLKDFAIPLEVHHNNTTEIFWKWFAVSDADAEQLIKKELGIVQASDQAQAEKPKRERKKNTKQTILPIPQLPAVIHTSEKEESSGMHSPPVIMVSAPLSGTAQAISLEVQPAEKTQEPLPLDDVFLSSLQRYFTNHTIAIKQAFLVKKNKEYEFTLNVPSSLGPLTYFCYAVNKKKIAEADISRAFVSAQLHKLPLIMLATGELTKPASMYLAQLQTIIFQQVSLGS